MTEGENVKRARVFRRWIAAGAEPGRLRELAETEAVDEGAEGTAEDEAREEPLSAPR